MVVGILKKRDESRPPFASDAVEPVAFLNETEANPFLVLGRLIALEGNGEGGVIPIIYKRPVIESSISGVAYLLLNDILRVTVDADLGCRKHLGEERKAEVKLLGAKAPFDLPNGQLRIGARILAIPSIPSNSTYSGARFGRGRSGRIRR